MPKATPSRPASASPLTSSSATPHSASCLSIPATSLIGTSQVGWPKPTSPPRGRSARSSRGARPDPEGRKAAVCRLGLATRTLGRHAHVHLRRRDAHSGGKRQPAAARRGTCGLSVLHRGAGRAASPLTRLAAGPGGPTGSQNRSGLLSARWAAGRSASRAELSIGRASSSLARPGH